MRRLIIKYLIIVIILAVIRVCLNALLPELFVKTIVQDNLTHTFCTFFGIYQRHFFNIILAIIMAVDLFKLGKNWIILPILTVLSPTAGLILFSVLIVTHLISNYEHI